MIQNIECPRCLGIGEAPTSLSNKKKRLNHISIKTCELCEGSGIVNEDLGNVYLNSLQIINYEEYVY